MGVFWPDNPVWKTPYHIGPYQICLKGSFCRGGSPLCVRKTILSHNSNWTGRARGLLEIKQRHKRMLLLSLQAKLALLGLPKDLLHCASHHHHVIRSYSNWPIHSPVGTQQCRWLAAADWKDKERPSIWRRSLLGCSGFECCKCLYGH